MNIDLGTTTFNRDTKSLKRVTPLMVVPRVKACTRFRLFRDHIPFIGHVFIVSGQKFLILKIEKLRKTVNF